MTDAELSDLVLTAIECPWLDFCLPTQQRKERRKERARVPPPVIPLDHATYRSDGACCATDRRGGWGAAYWAPGGQGRGASDENAYGHLGSSSTNNIAEYEGFRRALRRAVEAAAEPCVFEVDSQNVARQINGVNACRDKTLTPVYDDCLRLLGILARREQPWVVRHIYREWNAVADSLATRGTEPTLSTGGEVFLTCWKVGKSLSCL